jgi:hypothetical protein
VPGPAIEQMLGIGLGAPHPSAVQPARTHDNPTPPDLADSGAPPTPPVEPPGPALGAERAFPAVDPDGGPATSGAGTRTPRQRRRPTNQLPLFQPLSPANPESQTPSHSSPEPTTHP